MLNYIYLKWILHFSELQGNPDSSMPGEHTHPFKRYTHVINGAVTEI